MGRSPKRTFQLAVYLLAYLLNTATVGLVYQCRDSGHHRVGRREVACENVVEVLTDSSFAPEACRSHECAMLCVENCLVGWYVSRQP